MVESKKSTRQVIRVIFFLVAIAFFILAAFTNLSLSLLGIYLIIMILFVRDKELVVYHDRIELNSISLISKFSSKEIFYYQDISQIKYDKAFTNIKDVILNNDVWNTSTTSKPDTVEIYKSDNTWRIINRIGTKTDFENAFACMFSQMQSFEKS
jgi:hypothetical protein